MARKKKEVVEGQALPKKAKTAKVTVLATGDDAELTARVARAGKASERPHVASGDNYAYRNPYTYPAYCNDKDWAFRLVAWRGIHADDIDRLCNPDNGNSGFPWTICTRHNMSDWIREGREDEAVFNVAGAISVREQIVLYMPRQQLNAWRAWRNRYSAALGATPSGTAIAYEEGENKKGGGRTVVVHERSSVPEGATPIPEDAEV